MNYSVSEEYYIRAIYHLQRERQTVSSNALPAELNRPASATEMLKKLKFGLDQSLEIKTAPGIFFSISKQAAQNIIVHYETGK
ncbi:hypothetical protein [Agriterribacter sp.]|uniref:hypothetical protein n=1 Tax=Agriterribacter sp. TaxID=2821509 RepID=UPI002C420461|nr:hypothetical protein [Agriterribacter sp.]HRP55417.1 hypothetical protein [Agriterribacter sp.]